jgi:hypothetical protein
MSPKPMTAEQLERRSSGRLNAVLFDLDAVAVDLNTEMVGARDLSFTELLALLNRAEVALDAIQTSVAGLRRTTWQARGDAYGDIEIEGLPPVKLRRTSTRKRWDDRAVVDALLDRKLAPLEGDLPPAWDVADWLLDAAHVDYWRTGKLKELDIDPDDYCETVSGNPVVEFTRSGDNPLLAGDHDG